MRKNSWVPIKFEEHLPLKSEYCKLTSWAALWYGVRAMGLKRRAFCSSLGPTRARNSRVTPTR